jgi:outer membrane lipoprotein-sorting protein
MVALLCASALLASAQTAQEVMEKARKKYEALADVDLKFSQSVRFPASRVEQKITGTLQMKKGNRYRLETDEMTVVTDGTVLWSYSRATGQVIIDNFSPEERGFSPEKILSAAPADVGATLLGRERVGGTSCYILKLIPPGEQSFVRTMKLWIGEADHLTRKALVTDANGKESTYLVTEIHANIGVPDSRFSFTPPEGAEVVDLR